MGNDDCKSGFILDGTPRTPEEAGILDTLLSKNGDNVTLLIELNVFDDVALARICGRWLHKPSGRLYHVDFSPPKSYNGGIPTAQNMKDDVTGEQLTQRGDDQGGEEVQTKRLRHYHDQTALVVMHYRAMKSCKVAWI